jgi:transaldolase
MSSLETLKIRIFADGADLASMLELARRPHVEGLTTNPTLMRKAGIRDYRAFAREVLSVIRDKPVCFEVLADDFESIERQAGEIAGWADNVYVKIPVTNTRGESSAALIGRLTARRVKINVTAITTLEQVCSVVPALNPAIPSFVSVFAGRIADTGVDPVPVMARAVQLLSESPGAQLIWASSRELLNIFQADSVGCAVITVTRDILDKLTLIGYDLTAFSLDTVKMFRDDAQLAGYSL